MCQAMYLILTTTLYGSDVNIVSEETKIKDIINNNNKEEQFEFSLYKKHVLRTL